MSQAFTSIDILVSVASISDDIFGTTNTTDISVLLVVNANWHQYVNRCEHL
jgi:hypothetical protein